MINQRYYDVDGYRYVDIDSYELVLDELETTEKLLNEAKEAIRFYADKKNWREQVCKFHSNWQAIADMSKDGGNKAKECLAKLEEILRSRR